MPNLRLALIGLTVGFTALGAGGCKRENTAPDLQTTTGLQARDEPKSVSGCLRKGVAESTYVLVASQTTGATTTATGTTPSRTLALGRTVENTLGNGNIATLRSLTTTTATSQIRNQESWTDQQDTSAQRH